MAKNIIMQVLTSAGYEPMYPFTPRQILNSSFLATSTNIQYNISITGIPVPLTNSFGNDMGIIAFVPTVNNTDNITLSVNGDSALPILFADGVPVSPSVIKNTVIGAILGALIAIAIILISYVFNDTIMTSEDVEKKLGINVLGTLPLEEAEDDGDERRIKKKAIKSKKTR